MFKLDAFTRYYTAPWRTQAVRQHDLSRSRAGTEKHLFSLITGLISQNLDWNHQHLEFSTPDNIAGFTFRMWRVFFSAQQGVSKVPYKTEEEHPESLGLTAKWDSNKTDGDATWAKVQCGSSLQKTPFQAIRTLRSSGRAEFHWDSPATQPPPHPPHLNIRDRQAWSSSLKALRVKWWEWFGMKYRREKVTVKDIFTC